MPEGLEVGNAWALHVPGHPTNWIVGETAAIPAHSLRHIRQGGPDGPEPLSGLAVKWFVHDPSDPAAWGENKPISVGRTMSILAGEGAFELTFSRDGRQCRVLLDTSGDFVAWGAGLMHTWKPLTRCAVVTMRWAVEKTSS
jgi:hypothetical protein